MARRRKNIPGPTVERLCRYHRCLRRVARRGVKRISSADLAALAGVSPEQVRKDLSYFGSFGRRGVGYEVDDLVAALEDILGCKDRRVAIIGVGNLGSAIAGYLADSERGFEIAGLYDNDPARVGHMVRGMRIKHVNRLAEDNQRNKIDIAVLCVPESSAQQAAEDAVSAGIRAILNFAPITLHLPPKVVVRDADVAADLEWLSFWLSAH